MVLIQRYIPQIFSNVRRNAITTRIITHLNFLSRWEKLLLKPFLRGISLFVYFTKRNSHLWQFRIRCWKGIVLLLLMMIPKFLKWFALLQTVRIAWPVEVEGLILEPERMWFWYRFFFMLELKGFWYGV